MKVKIKLFLSMVEPWNIFEFPFFFLFLLKLRIKKEPEKDVEKDLETERQMKQLLKEIGVGFAESDAQANTSSMQRRAKAARAAS